MKRTFLFLIFTLILGTGAIANAQIVRQFGAQSMVLDNNDNIIANNLYLINVNGSFGIDNTGFVTGTYPNTTALVSLLAGSKTTNLRIDGGSTWGIDVVNTNNSIRTSGSNIFGNLLGNNSTTINITGTGSLTVTGIAAPALPSPLSNLLYVNGSNQVQQTPGGVNILSGSGTLNTIPLWTPNGNQLGNSIITQPTTSSIALTPAAGGTNVLTVNNFDATSTAIKINANGGTAINVDPASTGINIQATTTGINGSVSGTASLLSGINISATATAGQTGLVYGGSFSATAINTSNQIDGVIATANGAANGQTAAGGSFFSSGSNLVNFGVVGTTLGGTGQNISFQAQVSGANSVAYNVVGIPTTAFNTPSGNIILGSTVNTIPSGGTIPNGQSVVDVNDNGIPALVATVILPAGATNGQICYITTEDPDGVKITVGLASVTLSNVEVGTFMFINGIWRLEH